MKYYPKRIKCVRVRCIRVTIEFNDSLQKKFKSIRPCVCVWVYAWCVCVAMVVDLYSVSLVLFHWLKFTVYRTHIPHVHVGLTCYFNRVIPSSSCILYTYIVSIRHGTCFLLSFFIPIMIGVFFSFRFCSFLYVYKLFSVHFNVLFLYTDTDSIYCRLVFPLNSSYFQMVSSNTKTHSSAGFQFILLCLWNHRMH